MALKNIEHNIYMDNLPESCIYCEYLDYMDKYRCNKNKDDSLLINNNEECKYFIKREIPEECLEFLGKKAECIFWCNNCKAKKKHFKR